MENNKLKDKLKTIVSLAQECLAELGENNVVVSVKTNTESKKETNTGLLLKIVNKISDCDEADAIKNKVLDKSKVEGKILLCFYISNKYFNNEWLITSDIESITSELDVKIDGRNVSNYFKILRPYLESGAERKRGQSTPYRINRKGTKRFEEIINEN